MFCILSLGIHLLLCLIQDGYVHAKENNINCSSILENINNSSKVKMHLLFLTFTLFSSNSSVLHNLFFFQGQESFHFPWESFQDLLRNQGVICEVAFCKSFLTHQTDHQYSWKIFKTSIHDLNFQRTFKLIYLTSKKLPFTHPFSLNMWSSIRCVAFWWFTFKKTCN